MSPSLLCQDVIENLKVNFNKENIAVITEKEFTEWWDNMSGQDYSESIFDYWITESMIESQPSFNKTDSDNAWVDAIWTRAKEVLTVDGINTIKNYCDSEL